MRIRRRRCPPCHRVLVDELRHSRRSRLGSDQPRIDVASHVLLLQDLELELPVLAMLEVPIEIAQCFDLTVRENTKT